MNAGATLGRLLAIETSSRPGSIALRWEGRDGQRTLSEGRAHGADLLPALEGLFAELVPGLDARDRRVDAIVVGTGPGSFTGLRVGIATAQGLARAWDASIVGVPSFEAIARAALEHPGRCHLMADARAGRVYLASYARHDPERVELEVLRAPAALRWEELEKLDSLSTPTPAVGASSFEADTWLVERSIRARLAPQLAASVDPRELPVARAIDLLGLGERRLRRGETDGRAEPLYLMEFGASS